MRNLFVTAGHPKGIGLEIILKTLHGNALCLKGMRLIIWASEKDEVHFRQIQFPVYSRYEQIPLKEGIYFIKRDDNPAFWVVQAANLALENPQESILLTGPLDKKTIQEVYPNALGHKGLLAQITGINPEDLYMIFIGHDFNVFLATDHVSIFDLSNHLTISNALKALKTFERITQLAIDGSQNWKNVVYLGLNPHAGDGGLIGSFEKELTIPSGIAHWASPDTAFISPRNKTFFCWYHDQGLIPFKSWHGFNGIQWTWGLPFLRLSVDHGPAFDLYGKSKSIADSFAFGLSWAKKVIQRGLPCL